MLLYIIECIYEIERYGVKSNVEIAERKRSVLQMHCI